MAHVAENIPINPDELPMEFHEAACEVHEMVIQAAILRGDVATIATSESSIRYHAWMIQQNIGDLQAA